MIDYLSQLIPCPQCGAGRQVIEPDLESDNDDATIITAEGLNMAVIPPREGYPGVIEYIHCSKCGYEGPLVWCKKGFSHRMVATAWNDHVRRIKAKEPNNVMEIQIKTTVDDVSFNESLNKINRLNRLSLHQTYWIFFAGFILGSLCFTLYLHAVGVI